MKFNYEYAFNQDQDKWKKFDEFLYKLANAYPDEFEKEIYHSKQFILIGYRSSPPDLVYSFHWQVATEIQKQITNELRQLFP